MALIILFSICIVFCIFFIAWLKSSKGKRWLASF